jgi:hypothetical protein
MLGKTRAQKPKYGPVNTLKTENLNQIQSINKSNQEILKKDNIDKLNKINELDKYIDMIISDYEKLSNEFKKADDKFNFSQIQKEKKYKIIENDGSHSKLVSNIMKDIENTNQENTNQENKENQNDPLIKIRNDIEKKLDKIREDINIIIEVKDTIIKKKDDEIEKLEEWKRENDNIQTTYEDLETENQALISYINELIKKINTPINNKELKDQIDNTIKNIEENNTKIDRLITELDNIQTKDSLVKEKIEEIKNNKNKSLIMTNDAIIKLLVHYINKMKYCEDANKELLKQNEVLNTKKLSEEQLKQEIANTKQIEIETAEINRQLENMREQNNKQLLRLELDENKNSEIIHFKKVIMLSIRIYNGHVTIKCGSCNGHEHQNTAKNELKFFLVNFSEIELNYFIRKYEVSGEWRNELI